MNTPENARLTFDHVANDKSNCAVCIQVGYIVQPGRLTFQHQPKNPSADSEGLGVVFPLAENLRSFDALQLIEKACKDNDINWLRKAGRIWQLDLSAFRQFFNESSETLAWAEGVAEIEPEVHCHQDQQRVSFGDFGAIKLSDRTTVYFIVYKDEFLASRQEKELEESMMQRLGAMIGSPGDAAQERQGITDTILRWNAVNGADKGIFLEPVKWETHATPGLEGRPQGMINEELIPMSDFLIAVFRVRAGSPTGKEISGTIEEIREFMALGKYVVVYFYEGETLVKGLDPDQLKKVQDFKKEIQQHGLVESYSSVPDLQAKLAMHLSAIVKRLEVAKPGALSSRKNATARTQRPTTSLPSMSTPPPTPTKTQRTPRSKKPAPSGSSSVIDTSGRWIMLGPQFYEANSVRQNKNDTFTVQIPSTTAKDDAAISALRPHHFGRGTPFPFAHGNDAWIVTVKEVEAVSEGKGQLWTLTLAPEKVEYGSGLMEMTFSTAGRQYSPDDFARMRAGRILLNDPPPLNDKDRAQNDQALLDGAMLESHIRGVNVPAPVTACILQAVYNDYKTQPKLFLQLARLASIYFLKAGGVVERVEQLSLGPISKGKVHVKLRGVRRAKASNVEVAVVQIEGDCLLQ